MCHKCGKTFVRTKAMYLNTTEEGEQRPFCRACAMHCKTCDEWVSPALMVADHADCEADALVDEQGPRWVGGGGCVVAFLALTLSPSLASEDSGEDDSEESFVAADDESLSGQEEEEGDEEEEEEDESSDK